jgi:uncharacterized protein YkwD
VALKAYLAIALSALGMALLAPAANARDLDQLIAPTSACANQTDSQASLADQEQAMRCMTDYAREQSGMAGLGDAADLDRSAADKSSDILRCDEFSHHACGREFTYWMERVGYIPARCWRAGENIAWGAGEAGDVRSMFTAWIYSPQHRANILGSYSQIGVGLQVGNFAGHSDVSVWTQHFGSHCGAPSPPPRPPALRLARLSFSRVAG